MTNSVPPPSPTPGTDAPAPVAPHHWGWRTFMTKPEACLFAAAFGGFGLGMSFAVSVIAHIAGLNDLMIGIAFCAGIISIIAICVAYLELVEFEDSTTAVVRNLKASCDYWRCRASALLAAGEDVAREAPAANVVRIGDWK